MRSEGRGDDFPIKLEFFFQLFKAEYSPSNGAREVGELEASKADRRNKKL